MRAERRAVGGLATLLLASLSCASPPPAVAPQSAGEAREAVPKPPPPRLAPRSLAIPDEHPRPPSVRLLDESRFSLNVQDAELASLLLGLGRESPFNAVVDPGIRGRVTADFKDVSLREILEQLLGPRGYQYSVRGNVLRIFRVDRTTRSFRIDYPNYERRGSSDLTISGAIAASPDIGKSGGSSSGDEDTSTTGIQTTQVLDFWTEVETGLKGIVFGAAGSDVEDGSEPEGEGGQPAVPKRNVVLARHSGLVTVTAEPELLVEVEAYLQEVLLSAQRQVLIDVQILEIDIGDDLDLGVDWEFGNERGDAQGVFPRSILPGFKDAIALVDLAPTLSSGGFLFGIASQELGAVLAALAAQRDVRVVSTPRLATLNNHKALIKVVRNEVFFIAEVETEIVEGVGTTQTTEFTPQIVPVGVTLDITPQISEDGQITMHVHPSISEVVDVVDQPKSDPSLESVGSLPVIDLRETDTVMRVEDETTILIGGLIQSRELERQRKVPLLGDVPWLGQLFRLSDIEEQRTELVILVTPRILDAATITAVRVEAEQSLGELDGLRKNRLHEAPWWRRPFGEPYGVEAGHDGP